MSIISLILSTVTLYAKRIKAQERCSGTVLCSTGYVSTGTLVLGYMRRCIVAFNRYGTFIAAVLLLFNRYGTCIAAARSSRSGAARLSRLSRCYRRSDWENMGSFPLLKFSIIFIYCFIYFRLLNNPSGRSKGPLTIVKQFSDDFSITSRAESRFIRFCEFLLGLIISFN